MTTDALSPGSFLAEKYRVERVLGQGGMGVVVAATHLQLQQQVAIKVLLPEMARDPEVVARFLQEGRSQVRIQGEHVVRVLDVGTQSNGAPFMVMELLAGSDLGAVVEARGPLPAAEAVDYVLQAAEALAQAHSLGIIHRDLKPQNMFLTTRPDGSPLVKVLDFGISKNEIAANATRRARATEEGGILGSPAYMSPEQIKNPKEATAQSDIWSLGVILYELLTTHIPFNATSLAGILAAVTRDEPDDIRRHRPDLDESIATLVMRCLSRDLEDRPRDVADFAFALALDAEGHARAARIAQIVRRFSMKPPALAQTVLAGDATVMGFMPGIEKTVMAAQSSTFVGASAPTHRDAKLPMTKMWSRRWIAVAAGAAALIGAVAATKVSVARARQASAAGMVSTPPIASTDPIASASTSTIPTATATATATMVAEAGAPAISIRVKKREPAKSAASASGARDVLDTRK